MTGAGGIIEAIGNKQYEQGQPGFRLPLLCSMLYSTDRLH